MLRLSGTAPSRDVEDLIRELLEEDAYYDRTEHRSTHRETLVRPVQISIRGGETISAFSRNVSAAGMGLITNQVIAERAIGVLTIERIKGMPSRLLAECRWCRSYGGDWKISGWQFINVHQ
ncbi:PilZ domain-containing protein [Stieleria varia]|uniref:PilZ domain-containing protein n=1 Tax=Stieleria varia TaxID=2528005 RepID=A0A5C6A1N5_9BACT|nr:PilZ domain-containing protein [Stieleria varia]TWT93762.1 hypothetical protein Pla52n_55900 [Stieleria varia]